MSGGKACEEALRSLINTHLQLTALHVRYMNQAA